MEIINIRQQLHGFIEDLEDKKLHALYTLFENEINTDLQRKKLIQLEREKYLRGEDKSFSWEEVKQLAMKKGRNHAI